MQTRVFNNIESCYKYIGPSLKYGFEYPIHINHETKIVKEYLNLLEEQTVSWASYKLEKMPGCCGLVVSYNSFIRNEFQNYKLGDFFHKERITICKDAGYSCMIATSVENNTIQSNLFEKNDWIKVHSFTNKRTKNVVDIWIKDLNKEEN